ncbi:hypothetical protein BD408DRAFT_421087 [Parasitella parasitica]|nr:hypothetical protein BD408DRAFT_421087 [Parasitella parasitica]
MIHYNLNNSVCKQGNKRVKGFHAHGEKTYHWFTAVILEIYYMLLLLLLQRSP